MRVYKDTFTMKRPWESFERGGGRWDESQLTLSVNAASHDADAGTVQGHLRTSLEGASAGFSWVPDEESKVGKGQCGIRTACFALARVAPLAECCPVHPEFAGPVPVRALAWAVGSIPKRGVQKTAHWCFSLINVSISASSLLSK